MLGWFGARRGETAYLGNQIVVRHLLSTLFVYVLREWADAASPLAGNWFSALRSPHIARALACIHEAPANDWTALLSVV